jgi:hypothetical protein
VWDIEKLEDREINHKISYASMSCVLNLANILQLVVDSLNQCSFAQKDFVQHWHESIFHVLLYWRVQKLMPNRQGEVQGAVSVQHVRE